MGDIIFARFNPTIKINYQRIKMDFLVSETGLSRLMAYW